MQAVADVQVVQPVGQVVQVADATGAYSLEAQAVQDVTVPPTEEV